jgi:hypothetical protein
LKEKPKNLLALLILVIFFSALILALYNFRESIRLPSYLFHPAKESGKNFKAFVVANIGM